MVKKCIRKIILYHIVFMLVITLINFAIKDMMLEFFFVDKHVKQASESTMTLLIIDLFIQPFPYIVAGALR